MDIELLDLQNDVANSKIISNLLINNLHDDFISNLGENYIELVYLKQFSKLEKNITIIAKDNEKVIGFILASNSKNLLKKLVFNNKFLFFKSSYNFIYNKPKIAILKIISILKFLLRQPNFNNLKNYIELNYIVIDKNYRKKGIGSMLLKKLKTYYKNKHNITKIYVKTINGYKNGAAKDFYIKNGYKIIYECDERIILNT